MAAPYKARAPLALCAFFGSKGGRWPKILVRDEIGGREGYVIPHGVLLVRVPHQIDQRLGALGDRPAYG